MRKLGSIFLIWVTLLALFVSITGLLAKVELSARVFQILFIPVTAYLAFTFIMHFLAHTPALDRRHGLKRLLIYYCFVITAVLVVVSFLSSHTLPELVSAVIFSPLAIYFLLLVWPRPAYLATDIPEIDKSAAHQDLKDLLVPSPQVDVSRRDFLKLIGTAGIVAFLLNLFSRRNVPFLAGATDGITVLRDSGGNKIDPAEKSPTDGYYISQIDESTPTAYFGFVNDEGQWFIMREDKEGAFRYTKGNRDFGNNWERRNSFNYNYFDNVF